MHRFKSAAAAAHNLKNICSPSAVLHVASLPGDSSLTEQMLSDLFGQYGNVVHCAFFKTDAHMAMVAFDNKDDAVTALIRLHGFVLGSHKIRVSFSAKSLDKLRSLASSASSSSE